MKYDSNMQVMLIARHVPIYVMNIYFKSLPDTNSSKMQQMQSGKLKEINALGQLVNS